MIISEIKFFNESNYTKTIYCIYDGYPENVWSDIKQVIKEIQNNGEKLTFRKIVERVMAFNDYEESIPSNSNITNSIMVFYYKDIIKFSSKNFKDCYIISQNQEGNCIDDFVFRGVQSRINVINEYVYDIRQRVEERTSTNEYHQTSCYEKDFLQIFLIQKNAQKIVDNCKKQLELISEKYTKLD